MTAGAASTATTAAMSAGMSAASGSGWDGVATTVATMALIVAVILAPGAVTGVVLWRCRAARWDARRGTWWEITPPARPTPGSALAVWQAIGGALRRSRRAGLLPRRLAVEMVATPTALRAGVWLPPSIPAVSFAAALRAALPGATVTQTDPSTAFPAAVLAAARPGMSVVEVRPRAGVWAPLLNPAPHPPSSRAGAAGTTGSAAWSPHGRDGAEPLRGLFAALARRISREHATLQLVVRPARGIDLHVGAGGAGPTAARLLGALARTVAVLVLELLDIFTPGRMTRPGAGPGRTQPPADPVRAAAVKARDGKRAAGPHLAVTLRVAVATAPGVPERVRRGRVTAIVGGYDLVATPLQHCWMRWPRRALAARLPGRTFFATSAELAALWHLPTDPVRHGMAAPPALDVPPPRVLPQLPVGGARRATP